jgi:FkbM family methyltransferase
MNIISKLTREASEVAKDLAGLGLRATLGGLGRKLGQGVFTVPVRGVGEVHLRRDESDFHTVRQTFRDRQYAIENHDVADRVRRRYEEILAEGKTPVIVDAGANIGASALWFGAEYPRAAIVAIEPEPETVAMLRKNLAGRPNMTILAAAVGARPGHVTLTNFGHSSGTRAERTDDGMPVVTIQQAADHAPNGALLIVKVDIEGFEDDLFAENLDWIDEAVAVFIEPHDWMLAGRHTSRNFQRAFGVRDRELFLIDENLLYVKLA